MDSVGTINGVSALDCSLDSLEEKPWRKPGADITGKIPIIEKYFKNFFLILKDTDRPTLLARNCVFNKTSPLEVHISQLQQ